MWKESQVWTKQEEGRFSPTSGHSASHACMTQNVVLLLVEARRCTNIWFWRTLHFTSSSCNMYSRTSLIDPVTYNFSPVPMFAIENKKKKELFLFTSSYVPEDTIFQHQHLVHCQTATVCFPTARFHAHKKRPEVCDKNLNARHSSFLAIHSWPSHVKARRALGFLFRYQQICCTLHSWLSPPTLLW